MRRANYGHTFNRVADMLQAQSNSNNSSATKLPPCGKMQEAIMGAWRTDDRFKWQQRHVARERWLGRWEDATDMYHTFYKSSEFFVIFTY